MKQFVLVLFMALFVPVSMALGQDDVVSSPVMSLFGWFAENIGMLITAVTGIVGGFAIIATMTPNKNDDRIVQVILDVVNFFGANFGKAKNAE